MASKEKTPEPLIIDIEGNSREDGPGVRSVVFFKGCLLNCLWCQNPESKKTEAELWFDSDKCGACGECIKACPQDAIAKTNPHFIDRRLCDLCFECVDVCPYGALAKIGKAMSVEDVVKKLLRYKPFYETSGGGVTLSGGEPTVHMEFASALLKALKTEGIHTLIETGGHFDFARFEALVLPYLDMIYFDIKVIDGLEHKKLCGVGNGKILENFTRLQALSSSGSFDIIPRTPLIPGLTDSDHHIEELGRFYQEHGVEKASLLPNNPAWLQKLGRIGQVDPFDRDDPLRTFYDESDEERIRHDLACFGVEVSIGRMARQ